MAEKPHGAPVSTHLSADDSTIADGPSAAVTVTALLPGQGMSGTGPSPTHTFATRTAYNASQCLKNRAYQIKYKLVDCIASRTTRRKTW